MDTLFGGPAPWFTAPALLGTGFLLIQLVMGEIGGDLDADFDDPGTDAKWLSLQTVSAFFVGFGWLGLAALRLFDLGFGAAALIGAVAGFGVAWLMVWVTGLLMGLQSDANLSLEEAVGLEGTVTVAIPPAGGGSGRVTVVVSESQHDLPASQHGELPIHTHARVRVTRADDASGTVTVEPA
jgi:membrane protein implicated in regulation of membrane protease activity